MPNTSIAIKKPINYQRDFNYLQPRTNFYPLGEIRKVEEDLLSGFLQKSPDDENNNTNLPATLTTKADLTLASDYGDVGFEHLLSVRGPIRQALMNV